jgi:hypothetical protein
MPAKQSGSMPDVEKAGFKPATCTFLAHEKTLLLSRLFVKEKDKEKCHQLLQ